ncbi:MAG: sigma-70 family RNA polymerase sigma factor [Aquificaceae bacterium]
MNPAQIRDKAFSLVPEDFVSKQITMLSVCREKLYDSSGSLRGRIKEKIIRAYLKACPDKEVQELYHALRKEKERLVRENIGLVYAVMRRLRVSEEDWEEAYGYGLEGLLQAIEDWDGVHAFSTIAWFKIFSKIQDFYVSNSKESHLSMAGKVLPDEEDSFEVFFGELSNSYDRVELLAMIDSLPEKERLLVLKFLDGYTIKEIADLLGIKQKKAYRLFERACMRLRKLIEGGAYHDTGEGIQCELICV